MRASRFGCSSSRPADMSGHPADTSPSAVSSSSMPRSVSVTCVFPSRPSSTRARTSRCWCARAVACRGSCTPITPSMSSGGTAVSIPYALNIADFEPITGRIHQPPTVHQTFAGPNFVVCSFVPRKLDYHPDAIPTPYNHANVDSDEVLFYVGGEFTSRRGSGIGQGSLTLHPSGCTHGPQPGAVEASLGVAGHRRDGRDGRHLPPARHWARPHSRPMIPTMRGAGLRAPRR